MTYLQTLALKSLPSISNSNILLQNNSTDKKLIQSCALVLRSVDNFSAWPGKRLERSNTHDSLVP